MEQQKIVFVSHCALNTAAKVQRSAQEGEQEEKLRREFLHWVVDQGIQLIQLPCRNLPSMAQAAGVMSKNSLTIPFSATTAKNFHRSFSR